MIDIAVPSDSNINEKEYKKLQRYEGLKEELERMWKVKVKVVLVLIGALGAVTPRLEEWPQQSPGTFSVIQAYFSYVTIYCNCFLNICF